MRKVLHLMGTLSDEDVEWLTGMARRDSSLRNTTVIQEGKPLDALFIVLEGKLAVRITGLRAASGHPVSR